MGKYTEKPRNEWFETTFLPSFEDKMHNPEYLNQAILSEKQAQICHKYMDEQECRSNYGKWFTTYRKQVGGTIWSVTTSGRYTFLHRSFVPYRGHHGLNGRVRCRRLDRREDIDYYGREVYFKTLIEVSA